MDPFHRLLQQLRLTEFYLSLSIEEKSMFYHYANTLEYYLDEDEESPWAPGDNSSLARKTGLNPARFLWTTAANALPHRDFSFAEKLLAKALELARKKEDVAWIHLNFTQLYLDQQAENPEARIKGPFHGRETIKSGYFTGWAQSLLDQFV